MATVHDCFRLADELKMLEILEHDLRHRAYKRRRVLHAIKHNNEYQCGGGDVTAFLCIHGLFEVSRTCKYLHHTTRNLMLCSSCCVPSETTTREHIDR
jgi:hypothetical protein